MQTKYNPYNQASADELVRIDDAFALDQVKHSSSVEKERRGRSPAQPSQKKLDARKSYEIISPNLKRQESTLKYFDD